MNEPNQLEIVDGIGIFRPSGNLRFQQAVALITEAIAKAVEQGIKKILIDSHGLTNMQLPSMSERHWMVREWAGASQGKLKIAMLAPTAFSDPEKFGVVAAANLGVAAEVFTAEPDAIAWLRNIS